MHKKNNNNYNKTRITILPPAGCQSSTVCSQQSCGASAAIIDELRKTLGNASDGEGGTMEGVQN